MFLSTLSMNLKITDLTDLQAKLLLAQRAVNYLLAVEAKSNRRRFETVAYQADRLLATIADIEGLLKQYHVSERYKKLTHKNLLHARRKSIRCRVDALMLFLDDFELFCPVLSSSARFSQVELNELAKMKYSIPYHWGLVLSFNPIPNSQNHAHLVL